MLFYSYKDLIDLHYKLYNLIYLLFGDIDISNCTKLHIFFLYHTGAIKADESNMTPKTKTPQIFVFHFASHYTRVNVRHYETELDRDNEKERR